jgi:RNA polymerase sigma-54 factor
MVLAQRLEMRQGQTLVMTPQLLQAIRLLQLSHQELVAYIEDELEKNPLLERAETSSSDTAEDAFTPDRTNPLPQGETFTTNEQRPEPFGEDFTVTDREPSSSWDEIKTWDETSLSQTEWHGQAGEEESDPFATLPQSISLREHLNAQLDCAISDPRLRFIGQHIIDAINEAGYLDEKLDEIAARLGLSGTDALEGLTLVQSFDPCGIGARDLAECLALQLKERDRLDPAMALMLSRLDLVARRDIATLRRLCGLDEEDITAMIMEIRQLEPRPGRAFGATPVVARIPDVLVRERPEGGWLLELNPATLPKVLINQNFSTLITDHTCKENDKEFLNRCLANANWLTRSLEQRSRTILAVASEIVRQQDAFFAHGIAHLRPLTLKMVADALDMHESTVSRVTSNKCLATRSGVFDMKYFFSAAITAVPGLETHAAQSVRHRIRQLIQTEKEPGVLSDEDLVKTLKTEGIKVARRTVAKYREALRIPSSTERRRAGII